MELKRAFRLKWAQTQYERSTVSVRRQEESWQQIDEDVGAYEPLERIIEFEGGVRSESAVRAG
eukprot:5033645-Lingulodinium_polyedra.AAC.1